jgi:hypothetical protein
MSLPIEISGRETPAGDGSPLDTLIDFYWSFNASDLRALAANWAEGEAPSMDNPIGVSGEDGLPSGKAMRSYSAGQRWFAWRSTISWRRVTMTISSSRDVKKASAKLPLCGLSCRLRRRSRPSCPAASEGLR